MCPTVLCSIDISSVSVISVHIDDTSDETEVSATASVWLILCTSRVCALFSSKLEIVVVSLKEVCEFIVTQLQQHFSEVGATVILGPSNKKVRGPRPPGSNAYVYYFISIYTRIINNKYSFYDQQKIWFVVDLSTMLQTIFSPSVIIPTFGQHVGIISR